MSTDEKNEYFIQAIQVSKSLKRVYEEVFDKDIVRWNPQESKH
jgi:hypothetical protein